MRIVESRENVSAIGWDDVGGEEVLGVLEADDDVDVVDDEEHK